MKTLGGAVSNLEDAFDSFLLSIGEGGLNDAVMEAALTLSDMAANSEGLGKVIGEFLAVMVQEVTALIKDMAAGLRNLKATEVRSFLRGLASTLKKVLDVLVFVVKHWDSFLAILAGVKLQQGFSAAISGLRSMGVAASASLGPIGAITAALVALIPIAKDAGEELGNVLAKKRGIAREDKKDRASKKKRFLDLGEINTPESNAIGRAQAAASEELNAAERDVERLSSRQDLAYRPEVKQELREARARSARAQRKIRQLDAKAKGFITEYRKAESTKRELAAIQKGRLDRDLSATQAQLLREDEAALREGLRGSKKRREKAFKAGQKVLQSGGSLDEARAAAKEAAPRSKGGRGPKKDPETSAAAQKIDARIEELVKQAELSSYLKRTDLRGAEREAAALAAGKARKADLQAAVSEGRLSALGGEFAQTGTTQLLRDAGILGDNQNASPPVLTVTIVKADVKVDAPISVQVKNANATPRDMSQEFRTQAKAVLREEIGAAIESIRPNSRR
jgi:hypothetical protein